MGRFLTYTTLSLGLFFSNVLSAQQPPPQTWSFSGANGKYDAVCRFTKKNVGPATA